MYMNTDWNMEVKKRGIWRK